MSEPRRQRYRLVEIGPGERFDVELFAADDDTAAEAWARTIAFGTVIELWCDGRMIERWSRPLEV